MNYKRIIKKAIYQLFKVITLPFFGIYLIGSSIFEKRRAFAYIMQWVALIPGFLGENIRKALLEWVTGDDLIDCCIGFCTTFSDPRVRIGKGVYIGPKCDIGHVKIGNNVLIGTGVHILSGIEQHFFNRTDIPIKEQGGRFLELEIQEDVWIGNGAIVAANIDMGAVIGAGSIVLSPVPKYAVVVGNPARIIKYRK